MADEIIVTVADETPISITAGADTDVSITEGEFIKETFKVEKFTDNEGTDVQLDLESSFRAQSCSVFYNGVLMEKDVDYTEDEDRAYITILIELVATDKIEVRYVQD